MNITIKPHLLSGAVNAISSKSQAHRLLICAAFADKPTKLDCATINEDIEATADCLRALGAEIALTESAFLIQPIKTIPVSAKLNCRESGSTLRFMLPICGALGVETTFLMEGRLPQRPLSPLWEEMERMGCHLQKHENKLDCSGRLIPGKYSIAGNISSQFITGLIFALCLIPGDSQLIISGKLESAPYVDMTKDALSQFGVNVNTDILSGSYPLRSPGSLAVEGDWSNAAFFLTANALGSSIDVIGLSKNSYQGDRAIADLLPQLTECTTVSAANIPDLIPILSVAAAASQGALFTDIRRLRLKESDRVKTVEEMLGSLGCRTESTENELRIFPGKFNGGTLNAHNDHRIAMAAAIAATIASGPVTITGAECVKKSYPTFWKEYEKLGGSYEQHIW